MCAQVFCWIRAYEMVLSSMVADLFVHCHLGYTSLSSLPPPSFCVGSWRGYLDSQETFLRLFKERSARTKIIDFIEMLIFEWAVSVDPVHLYPALS